MSDLVAGRPHPLKGKRGGQFAVDLAGGSRLVFKPNEDPCPRLGDGAIDWHRVTHILIVFICTGRLPLRPGADPRRVTVPTEVLRPRGAPVAVSYRMVVRVGRWLTYGVVVEEVSLRASDRDAFGRISKLHAACSVNCKLLIKIAQE